MAESDVVQMRHNLWVCAQKKRMNETVGGASGVAESENGANPAERCVMRLRGSDDTRELDVNKLRPVNISRRPKFMERPILNRVESRASLRFSPDGLDALFSATISRAQRIE
jgi:hypothetical protein